MVRKEIQKARGGLRKASVRMLEVRRRLNGDGKREERVDRDW